MADLFLTQQSGDLLEQESAAFIVIDIDTLIDPRYQRSRTDPLTRAVVHAAQPVYDVYGRRERFVWELH